MMRHNLKPIVFVLNNSGYTIERYLHGKTRRYNDISNWCVPFSSCSQTMMTDAVRPIGNGRSCSTRSAARRA